MKNLHSWLVKPKAPEALPLDEDSNLNPPALTVSTPGGGDYVYAVSASWGSVGRAEYTFCTVP